MVNIIFCATDHCASDIKDIPEKSILFGLSGFCLIRHYDVMPSVTVLQTVRLWWDQGALYY